MDKKIPNDSKVVVIGGGVAGTSCAYHLAKFGWKNVVLLERDQLTSGTTWHAAGLMGQLGASSTITKLRKYSLDLYKELESKSKSISKQSQEEDFFILNPSFDLINLRAPHNINRIIWDIFKVYNFKIIVYISK